LENPVTFLPMRKSEPDGFLTLFRAIGAWHTAATGRPEATSDSMSAIE